MPSSASFVSISLIGSALVASNASWPVPALWRDHCPPSKRGRVAACPRHGRLCSQDATIGSSEDMVHELLACGRSLRHARFSLAMPAVAVAQRSDSAVRRSPRTARSTICRCSTTGELARASRARAGRIVFEFTGDACEGYTLTFRQVTVLGGAKSGRASSDLRSTTFEDGDGSTVALQDREPSGDRARRAIVDGVASREDRRRGTRQPHAAEARDADLEPAEALVPDRADEAGHRGGAQAGETHADRHGLRRLGQGRKVYDTLSVIGKPDRRAPARSRRRCAQAGWTRLARWPVTISYFEAGAGRTGRRSTRSSFELYENGVSARAEARLRRVRPEGRTAQRLDLPRHRAPARAERGAVTLSRRRFRGSRSTRPRMTASRPKLARSVSIAASASRQPRRSIDRARSPGRPPAGSSRSRRADADQAVARAVAFAAQELAAGLEDAGRRAASARAGARRGCAAGSPPSSASG